MGILIIQCEILFFAWGSANNFKQSTEKFMEDKDSQLQSIYRMLLALFATCPFAQTTNFKSLLFLRMTD